GGSLSALTWNADHTGATATFTAAQDSETAGSVAVVSYKIGRASGRAGESDTVTIDTRNPTVAVDIVDDSLNDGDVLSNVTFSFSEVVNQSWVVLYGQGGSLSALAWNADHTGATATFTAAQDSETAGSVAVVSY